MWAPRRAGESRHCVFRGERNYFTVFGESCENGAGGEIRKVGGIEVHSLLFGSTSGIVEDVEYI